MKSLSIHSARGLQFRIIVLLWTDLLPSAFTRRDESIERGLLYVAMTRADMLVVLHSGSSSYVEELYRTMGSDPPQRPNCQL